MVLTAFPVVETLVSRGVPAAPAVVGLIGVAALVAAAIYRHHPPLPGSLLWGLIPWTMAGASLQVLARNVAYPRVLEPVFASVWVYLLTLTAAGLAWLAILVFSTSRESVTMPHYYVGAMGTGTMVVAWGSLLSHLSALNAGGLLVFLAILVVAFVASIALTISAGLWSVDLVQYAVAAGAFVVFGALVRGTAVVADIAINGPRAHTTVSAEIQEVAMGLLQVTGAALDATFLWAWLLLLAYIGVAILAASQLAPYGNTRSRAVTAALGVIGGGALVTGLSRLVEVVVA